MEIAAVSDGDTFKVRRAGASEEVVYTVRLIGIDTPEKHASSKLRRDAEGSGRDVETIQALGQAATRYATELLQAPGRGLRQVTLSYDPAGESTGHRGRYGRVVAYVWALDAEGRRAFMVNRRLVADGYAYAYTSYPFAYADEFIQLQRVAIENGRGLWGNPPRSGLE